MPKRSLVTQLPDEIKTWLNQQLLAGGFSGYEAMAEALEEKGFIISKSTLHRYGKAFEETTARLKLATEQAKAIVEVTADDSGAQTEALLRLVQEKFFSLLVDLEMDPKSLPKVAHAVSDLARASVSQKKWMTEVREKAKKAAEEVTKIAKKGGISEEAIAVIESEILGITR